VSAELVDNLGTTAEQVSQSTAPATTRAATQAIRFSDWNPDWQPRFTAEADRLRRTLGITSRGGAMDIQHIGGTAVPHMAGADTIDMLLITPDLASFDARRSLLIKLGYTSLGDGGRSGQRKLILGERQVPSVTLYVYQPGNRIALHHLLVRDFLRTHPDERRQYALLKQRLVDRTAGTSQVLHSYEKGKRPRLTRLLERATGRR